MINWGTKTNDTAGAGGQVGDVEYNSLFNEQENAVTVFGTTLNEADNKQLQKAIDIAVKASNYQDGGTANTITLTRPITAVTTEALFDGMVVYFSPKFANTGATTIKVTTLLAKPAKYLGSDPIADFFKTDSNYRAVYDAGNEWFEVDKIVNKKNLDDAIAGVPIATAVLSVDNMIHIQDIKTSGTSGGTFTLGARRTRDLNTVQHNTIVGASRSVNQVLLPIGVYWVEIEAPAYRVNRNQAYLENVSDVATELSSNSTFAPLGGTTSMALIKGLLTVTGSTKTFEVQHESQGTDTNGFGLEVGGTLVSVVQEQYTDFKAWKVG